MTKLGSNVIVHVSSAHPWTDNRIHYRECATLQEAGFQVALVAVDTAMPGRDSGVSVIRIPPRRLIQRLLISAPQAILAALRTRAATMHLHDPELIPFIPLLRLMGKKVIYDAHEDLPRQVVSKSYIRPWNRSLLKALAKSLVWVSKSATHVVCATTGIGQAYGTGWTLVRNYPPLRPEEADHRRAPIASRAKSMVYVGVLSANRGGRVMVQALSEASMPASWALELAGRATKAFMDELEHLPAWERVIYHGQVPPETARDITLNSSVGLVLLSPTPAYVESLPTKMFEYFAAGLPVIASDFPLWREIVEKYNCGVLVEPSSPAAVAEAVRKYAENPGLLEEHSLNARNAAVREFNWAPEGKRLVNMYTQMHAHAPSS